MEGGMQGGKTSEGGRICMPPLARRETGVMRMGWYDPIIDTDNQKPYRPGFIADPFDES